MLTNFNGRFFLLLLIIFLPSGSIFAQQSQPSIQIISPADGTIVTPGETITVKVSAVGRPFSKGVMIIAQYPIQSSKILTSQPYQFSITIPNDIQVGRYYLTAFGMFSSQEGIPSTPITIDVESTVQPTSLQAVFGGTPLTQFTIDSVGEQLPLQIQGVFPDGSVVPLNESSSISFSSSNTAIVTVDKYGILTAVSPGNATVTATYSHTNPPLQIAIPVTVPQQTITLTPWSLIFNSQPVGTTSSPQTVTLISTKPLNSIQVTTTGDFSETDNCSMVPTASCNINVKFLPTAVGNRTGALSVSTELTATATSVSLSGTGTAVSFSDFDPKLHIYNREPFGFHMRGTFTLGKGSSGIDPIIDGTTLTLANYYLIIPKNSFERNLKFPKHEDTGYISSKQSRYHYRGKIEQTDVDITIEPDENDRDKYRFEIKATGDDLSPFQSPVAVSLLIGANVGTATIQPPHHSDSDKDEGGWQ